MVDENVAAKREASEKRFIPKPEFLSNIERKIGRGIKINPSVVSAAKLLIITPLLFLTLKQFSYLPNNPYFVSGLFLLFFLFDYLDGLIAREQNRESKFGMIFDRVTDYPLLLTVAYFSAQIIPTGLLAAKLILDGILLVLFSMGKGSTENRLRTGINYTIVISLLFLSQGWAPKLIRPEFIENLLYINICFSAAIALHNLGIIGKFLIADMLSLANMTCGLYSMYYASKGQFGTCLIFLIIGGALDGLDGAAARKWGGTKWGVYSDDVADGVNYGIAPGVALYYALPGLEGLIVGIFYSVFTISRLVFFTINKEGSDPNFFAGVPSTIGGIITVCGIIVFRQFPAVIGALTGIVCVQMVSFDTHYRHLGRAVSKYKKQALYGGPLFLLVLVVASKLWGNQTAAAIILGVSLAYGFIPTYQAFKNSLS